MAHKDDIEPNVFVRRHNEQMARELLAVEGLPVVDLDRLPKFSTGKPSPAGSPSSDSR